MKQTRNEHHGTPEPEIPEQLARDLAAQFGRGVAVPGDLDRRITAQARLRFSRRRAWPRLAKWAAAVSSVAAAVFLVIHLAGLNPMAQPEATRDKAATATAKITILDAFRLARLIKQGAQPAATWDRNGDGAVNHTDVDLVAMAAVSLEGG